MSCNCSSALSVARENPTWTAGRIARELGTKLPVDADTETVRRYMPRKPVRRGIPRGDQRWSTFIHNHAKTIVACDFAVSMRLRFQVLYVFVIMEIGSRRILHINVTDHPTAEWTTRQLRTAIPGDSSYRYLLDDRDSIFSRDLDAAMGRLGLKVVRSPVRAPRANSFVERLIGSLRREVLDWLIPLTENQLRALAREWAEHYNRERPHMSLGPGFPDPAEGLPVPRGEHRHRLPEHSRVVSKPVLGGLHHEYRLENIAA